MSTDKRAVLHIFKKTITQLDAIHAEHFPEAASIQLAVLNPAYPHIHRENARLTLERAEQLMRVHFPGARTFDDVLQLATIVEETGLWPGPVASGSASVHGIAGDVKGSPPARGDIAGATRGDIAGATRGDVKASDCKAGCPCMTSPEIKAPRAVILPVAGEAKSHLSVGMADVISKMLTEGKDPLSAGQKDMMDARKSLRVISNVKRKPTHDYMKVRASSVLTTDSIAAFRKFYAATNNVSLDYMEFDVGLTGSLSVELPYTVGPNTLYYERDGLHYYLYENSAMILPRKMDDVPNYFAKTYEGTGPLNFTEMAAYRYKTIDRSAFYGGMQYVRCFMRHRNKLDMSKLEIRPRFITFSGEVDSFEIVVPVISGGQLMLTPELYRADSQHSLCHMKDAGDLFGAPVSFMSEIELEKGLTQILGAKPTADTDEKRRDKSTNLLVAVVQKAIEAKAVTAGPKIETKVDAAETKSVPTESDQSKTAVVEIKSAPTEPAQAKIETKVVPTEPAQVKSMDSEMEFLSNLATTQLAHAAKSSSKPMKAAILQMLAQTFEDFAKRLG